MELSVLGGLFEGPNQVPVVRFDREVVGDAWVDDLDPRLADGFVGPDRGESGFDADGAPR